MSGGGGGTLRAPGCRPASTVLDAAAIEVAIVASQFNAPVVQRLVDGALARLEERGVARVRITFAQVPGAFELPLACRTAAATGRFAAVVALGCVIRGETPHFDYVCAEAARGIADAARETGVPVAFGVLTTDTADQALARAGGDRGNKGADAADAALDTAAVVRALA